MSLVGLTDLEKAAETLPFFVAIDMSMNLSKSSATGILAALK